MGNSIESLKNKNNVKNKPLVIMLRGHIRNSFKDDKLYRFICELKKEYDIYIYIHTWKILQSSISWRRLEQDNTPVTEIMINNYFRECKSNIKSIIIETDKGIGLIGNLFGNICNSKMPIIGWKNMWYGMNNNITKISNDIPPNIPIVNMRFDLFDVFKGSLNNINVNKAIEYIKTNYKDYYNKNIFYYKYEEIGIDHIIMGNVSTMFRLIHHFNNDLDNIVLKYPNNKHQEFLVYRENNLL
jgi:hypothetical protein